MEQMALSDDKVKDFLKDMKIVKTIVIPGKLVEYCCQITKISFFKGPISS